jgi:peroxiredoxin
VLIMLGEGAEAPPFELPAVVDGSIRQVALDDYVEQVVVLAFYPGDFNPDCDDEHTGLDALDVFTMQKDVAVLGISGDSIYSHRAFAEAYDLHIPLLSDVDGTIAEAYGVTASEGVGHLTRRAVVVVGLDGTVKYAWTGEADKLDIEGVWAAFDAVDDGDIARERYSTGHYRYVEGRAAFAEAVEAHEAKEWVPARRTFEQARAAFAETSALFDSAARFDPDERAATCAARAAETTEQLARAAEWLRDAAESMARGDVGQARGQRSDSERALAKAHDIGEPLPPEDIPPEELPEGWDEERPDTVEDIDTSGSLGIDFEVLDEEAWADDERDARTDKLDLSEPETDRGPFESPVPDSETDE